ncbi:GntR family transcriptional regulator [Pedobacter jamesrossensis]|uniref:GntR family transcriptional regulator n=1 Tax=Pedobacter jamesrossensis TaxID=1908238 RepID=A0ABV8NSE7_9SPHI
MNSHQLVNSIHINEYSVTPKYQQVTNLILNLVQTGKLSVDMGLPSINELSIALDISRDTIEKGYKSLRDLGVVTSVPGKGYYIIENEGRKKHKVCLILNKWSGHKKIIYDSLADALGEQASLDLNIYNNSFNLFKKIITSKIDHYSHYVIIPPAQQNMQEAIEIIQAIPQEKLIILDKLSPQFKGISSTVYEDFDRDIFCALEKALNVLSKYNKLNIIFPSKF